ncbi:MAG: hypothetical protein Q8P67_21030 [archaeon]|nr:hypothetical protein [archaeon]
MAASGTARPRRRPAESPCRSRRGLEVIVASNIDELCKLSRVKLGSVAKSYNHDIAFYFFQRLFGSSFFYDQIVETDFIYLFIECGCF